MLPFNIDPAYFGIIGGFLGNLLFFPQIVKGFKTKSMGDLSKYTYILIFLNASNWTIFGLGTDQPIVWVANITSSCLTIFLLCMMRRYK